MKRLRGLKRKVTAPTIMCCVRVSLDWLLKVIEYAEEEKKAIDLCEVALEQSQTLSLFLSLSL